MGCVLNSCSIQSHSTLGSPLVLRKRTKRTCTILHPLHITSIPLPVVHLGRRIAVKLPLTGTYWRVWSDSTPAILSSLTSSPFPGSSLIEAENEKQDFAVRFSRAVPLVFQRQPHSCIAFSVQVFFKAEAGKLNAERSLP